ncbi:hypothetical protein JRO89_XS06G0240900 [Xanthoceras sorbifolium]|uniref:Thioredoxin domain-containing protein n=1 Tax=Xanthoceras sorbifolium TaxID=99658 RepID=A0ABQ8HZ87_9ROSI|nr:hypothetical protein JRO89_XS06G0240900 [Xanthoceras sorbifolium]
MRGNSIYRRFLLLQQQRKFSYRVSSTANLSVETLISPPTAVPSPSQNTIITKIPSSDNRFCMSKPSLQFHRPLCSSSPDGPLNIIPIKSEEEFNSSLSKVQDGSLPAIYYFTAAWCGPCRFISPVIVELSKKYPHVTTYKIDIDQVGRSCGIGLLLFCFNGMPYIFLNFTMIYVVSSKSLWNSSSQKKPSSLKIWHFEVGDTEAQFLWFINPSFTIAELILTSVEGLRNTLSKLHIAAVVISLLNFLIFRFILDEEKIAAIGVTLIFLRPNPTLHFFQNGKKAAEVVGADILSLKNTVEKLYK